MPPVGMAMRMLFTAAPWTKKPPPWLKLELWNLNTIITMIVSTGMSTFQVVSELLTRASHWIPIRFTMTKTNISTIATTIPTPLSVPLLLYQLDAQLKLDRY